jgi:hypothetical protein
MRTNRWLAVGVVIAMTAMSTAFAQTNTFRTPARFVRVIQDTNGAGKPQYDFETFIGRDLVNLALGTARGTTRTNEVLALEITCDSSSVQLVVFDKAASSNIATIATSSSIDIVQQQDNDLTAFPNRERFVTVLDVATLGNGSNGLVGGFLTVAGRIHLNPTNGCPRAVLVDTDRREDKICGDPKDTKNTDGDNDRSKFRAGRAHFIGVLDIVSGGSTNTALVPAGALTIWRQLLP